MFNNLFHLMLIKFMTAIENIIIFFYIKLKKILCLKLKKKKINHNKIFNKNSILFFLYKSILCFFA